MCGICGFINFKRPASGNDQAIVQHMNAQLIHRGPDAQDTLVSGNLAFGFSRLSIIGLENGMQPIHNEDNSVVLICNGEIFNYIEIRKELMEKGHRFATGSDVEVIVHLYEEYGMGFLNMLNGQFAFALYDKKSGSLFCARDHMGIIPFFYTETDDSFIFGSEIKAILKHPDAPRQVDFVGLDQVLTFAGLISPRTMFRDIYSLENGHYLEIGASGSLTKHEYWDLVYPEQHADIPVQHEAWYIDQLESLFEASLKLRLRSDVPVGLYLSGGLDSSMILMKMRHLQPSMHIDAFSIDFVESGLSESMYQRLVADRANARLSQKTFFYDDISLRLKHAVYHCECPVKETYNTASLSLSEAAGGAGVKVILSGEGSDELFAGYVGYRFDKMRHENGGGSPATMAEERLRHHVWNDSSFFYERDFLQFNKVKKQLYSEELRAIFDDIDCLQHPVVNTDRIRNRDVLHKRAYIDYKLRLVDHLISDHGDRMALANSVEVRYPFLDKDLVEFSTRIPAQLKLKDYTEKYILKKMAERFVPQKVVDREKFGFVAPGSPYLIQRNIAYINELLSFETIKRQGVFDPAEVQRLVDIYKQPGFYINAPFEDDLLMTVISFGILHDLYF
ncbi:asparagine synthase (glutamine-hydrolyzing) [Chitinophaga sp. ARDCPP14]|uniref:asparagine synthase (glutamine-hydrolyzing) n=1 Tax=Chitinophaga sp. ARDCPP14 TaxID=3391139 RepID=UPI003F51B634